MQTLTPFIAIPYPYSIDNHYEYWMVASSYLAYGGSLQVIRADDFNSLTGVGLKNAFVGTAFLSSQLINSPTISPTATLQYFFIQGI